jgi:hypothetical protein
MVDISFAFPACAFQDTGNVFQHALRENTGGLEDQNMPNRHGRSSSQPPPYAPTPPPEEAPYNSSGTYYSPSAGYYAYVRKPPPPRPFASTYESPRDTYPAYNRHSSSREVAELTRQLRDAGQQIRKLEDAKEVLHQGLEDERQYNDQLVRHYNNLLGEYNKIEAVLENSKADYGFLYEEFNRIEADRRNLIDERRNIIDEIDYLRQENAELKLENGQLREAL